MALGIRLLITQGKLHMRREPTVWTLMGDSEMAEGQIWEAMEAASHYQLNNMVAVVDVNRLGQSGETGLSWHMASYAQRAEAFGWQTILLKNGHNIEAVYKAFKQADSLNTVHRQKPLMIIAKTVKGRGVPFLEDKPTATANPCPLDRLTRRGELGSIDLRCRRIYPSGRAHRAIWTKRNQALLYRLEKVISVPVPSPEKPATYHLRHT
jgi:transketolase